SAGFSPSLAKARGDLDQCAPSFFQSSPSRSIIGRDASVAALTPISDNFAAPARVASKLRRAKPALISTTPAEGVAPRPAFVASVAAAIPRRLKLVIPTATASKPRASADCASVQAVQGSAQDSWARLLPFCGFAGFGS